MLHQLAGTGNVVCNVLRHQWATGQVPVAVNPEACMGAAACEDEWELKALLPSSAYAKKHAGAGVGPRVRGS